jgi:hypothetical protein
MVDWFLDLFRKKKPVPPVPDPSSTPFCGECKHHKAYHLFSPPVSGVACIDDLCTCPCKGFKPKKSLAVPPVTSGPQGSAPATGA